jgi:SH3-like domain-containing protein
MMVRLFFLVSLLLAPFCIIAAEELALPRFVSIKANDANIRTGPGKRYPLKWQISRKNVPVEVLTEFEQWRKIRDVSGDEGWVHQSILSGNRYIILESEQIMRRSDSKSSRPTAKLEAGVIARLKTCTPEWCQIEVNEVAGWVPRKSVWGVYTHENLAH